MSRMTKTALVSICLSAFLAINAQTVATVAKPIKAEVIDGHIETVFADGHKEVLSKDKTCARPRVSAKGDVGWSTWNDTNTSGMGHSGETLHIRFPDGTIKDFKPNSRFILDWNFADHDSAIVIASMGYHGSNFYIKYDLSTGKVLGQVDHYESDDELPAWAQSFADK
jgi:hypothetical protein